MSEEDCKLIDALQFYEFRDVVFSGGEPFLRRDLMELITYAVERGLKTHVCTNCSLLDRQKVRRLVDMDVRFCISLDGSNPDIHGAVRGKSCNFEQVIRVMEWLEAFGAPILVKTVLMRENVDDQFELRNLLKQFKGAEWRHDPANVMRFESGYLPPGVKAVGDQYVWSDYQDPDMIRQFCNVVDELAALQRCGDSLIQTNPENWGGIKGYIRGDIEEHYRCNLCRLSSMPVTASGDISLCGTWVSHNHIIGNVIKQDYRLEEIWNSERAQEARKRSLKCSTLCWIDGRNKEEKLVRLQDRFPETLEKMTITRWKLLQWMVAEVDRVNPRGQVLEIGSTMSMKYLFNDVSEFVTSDCFYTESWHPKGQPIERKEDVTNLSFANNTFDVVLCHQVLEHVDDLSAAAREIHRVLRPGGILWFSSPFIDHYHPTPKDYWRISRDGYLYLLNKFSKVNIEEFGNLVMYPLVLSKDERSDWDPDEYGPVDRDNPLQFFGWAIK